MGLFRKKKRNLEADEFTLPEPPEMPLSPHHTEDLPELPELSPLDEDDDMIKEEFDMPEERGRHLKPGSIEMDEELPALMPPSESLPPGRVAAKIPRRFISPVERPIFVKIDKFKDSLRYLDEIREKLRNSSTLLKRLRELRQQEDQELSSWEKDLEDLKSKLEGIDKKLFSDVG